MSVSTLWLLRHAKSAWDDPSLDDHDRPLALRGERACELLREHCARRVRPERIVCSTALRTRQTFERTLGHFDPAAVRFEPDIYEAPHAQLAECVRRHGEGVRALLVVGHNPGLQSLALWALGAPHGSKQERAHARLSRKLPTGALLTLELPRLESLHAGCASLEAFVTPKELAAK